MSKMKLNINARRTITLYDINGKPYKLRKGSNDFCLEYKDYVALAKSLGITIQPDPDAGQPEPAVNTKAEDKESAEDSVNVQTNEHNPELKEAEEPNEPTNESETKELTEDLVSESTNKPEPEVKESTEENIPVEAEAHDEESLNTAVEEQHIPASDEVATSEDNSQSDKDLPDYSTWSYTKLKAEYKSITGKSCKLKKEEVIQFLQEQNNV